MIRKQLWRFAIVLMFLGGPVVLTGCGVGDNPTEQTYVTEIAD